MLKVPLLEVASDPIFEAHQEVSKQQNFEINTQCYAKHYLDVDVGKRP